MTRDSDTRRMVETGTGSMRSTGSAVPQGNRPSFDDLMAAETRRAIKFNQFLDGLGK